MAGLEEDDMASLLTVDPPAGSLECLDGLGAGDERPLAARASTQAAIASRMFASASSSVRPCETQPGIAGHSATTMPVSSRSRVTTSLIDIS
jgi:hypothetical protein